MTAWAWWNLSWLLLAALLAGTLAGLACGWHRGRRFGRREGRAEAPLVWREQALREGSCPLCHTEADYSGATAAADDEFRRAGCFLQPNR